MNKLIEKNFYEINHKDLNIEDQPARFRRATMNMIASTLCCEKTIDESKIINKNSIGFIYASFFGEIETSTHYLELLKTDKIAKPILFQNSLHNSALGFVSIELGLQGPSITLNTNSKHYKKNIQDAAETLLMICDCVLVCISNSVPLKFYDSYALAFPEVADQFNKTQSFLYTTKDIHHYV